MAVIVDHFAHTMRVHSVGAETVVVHVIPPGDRRTAARRDDLDALHHFPRVATSVIFPAVTIGQLLYVMLSDTTLEPVTVDDHDEPLFNFHVHKHRMVYGQLRTFTVVDDSVADKIYLGAPIYDESRKLLVSVVTTLRRPDRRYPITGIRAHDTVSGQLDFDDELVIQRMAPGMSLYGRRVLPYDQIKRHALECEAKRETFRNKPRAAVVTHGSGANIVITLVEGEFEMFRVRMNGSLA